MVNQLIKRTVIYEALFDDREVRDEYGSVIDSVLDEYKLEIPVTKLHVTVCFRPEVDHRDLYGMRAYAMLRAYGNDGKNEGYKVDIFPREFGKYTKNKKEFAELINGIEIPHITVSVSSDGRAIDTKNLRFENLPWEKVELFPVKFGAFVKDEWDDGTIDTGYVYSKWQMDE